MPKSPFQGKQRPLPRIPIYDQSAASPTLGSSEADAKELADVINRRHLPISAIVIGSENYGSWDFQNDRHTVISPYRYAKNVQAIAKLFRSLLPNVKLGVSFDDGSNPFSLSWDQTVLRLDGPYVDFVSVHEYPFPGPADGASPMTLTQLDQQMPAILAAHIQQVKQEIAANTSPSVAAHLQIWATEMTPENGPDGVSFQEGYGGTVVEEMAYLKALGVSKEFLWSFDGGYSSSNKTGSFSLISNGDPGMVVNGNVVPNNGLLPAGQGVQAYMQAIGSGAAQTLDQGANGMVASLAGSTTNTSFWVNTTSSSQTYTYVDLHGNNESITLPADGWATAAHGVASATGMTVYAGNPVVSSMAPLPIVTHIDHFLQLGKTYTIEGKGFGSTQGNLHIDQGTLTNGEANGTTVSWGVPQDYYQVPIVSWSNTKIVFQVPDNQANPPAGFSYTSLTPNASAYVQVISAAQTISPYVTVKVLPQDTKTYPMTLQSLRTVVHPGDIVTIEGNGFGDQQPKGYVQMTQTLADGSTINFGAPGDTYSLPILAWTNTMIQFRVPLTGRPLLSTNKSIDSPGVTSTTLQVNNGQGSTSNPIDVNVGMPRYVGSFVVNGGSSSASPGTSVTLSSPQGLFGATQGNLIMTQQNSNEGSVTWGAPWDSFGITVTAWSPTSITFTVPSTYPTPSRNLLDVVTASGQWFRPILLTT